MQTTTRIRKAAFGWLSIATITCNNEPGNTAVTPASTVVTTLPVTGSSLTGTATDDQVANEQAQLVDFLNALTDTNFDKTIPASVPSRLPVGGSIR